MLALSLAIALVFCVYGLFRLFTRTRTQTWSWHVLWRLVCLIAGLRISALWLGLSGLHRPDWAQIAAYVLLTLDLPELYFVRGFRADPYRWAMLGSLILAGTSFAWAAALVYFRNWRVQSSTRPEQN